MSHTHTTFNPVALKMLTANTVVSQNAWISKKKALCWKCQKDVPKNEGRFSCLIRGSGVFNSSSTLKKFICFKCKPEQLEVPKESLQ